jgi:hypothetical protein
VTVGRLCAIGDTLTTVIANTPASIARVIVPSGSTSLACSFAAPF